MVQLNSSGKVTVYAATLADQSTDNCAVWSYSPAAKTYTTANLGANNLTITVKDYSNNTATCVSVVTVMPSLNNEDYSQGGGRKFDFVLFPNPTSGATTAAFALPTDQAYLLRIFDLSGRLIFHREGEGVEGENNEAIMLGGIAAGVYIVDFQSEGLKAQKRLVVQE